MEENNTEAPKETKEVIVKDQSREIEMLFEKYFNLILIENLDDAYSTLQSILLIKNDKIILFLIFWYPFVNNKDDLVIRILTENTVYYNNQAILKDLSNLQVSSNELNTFAYKLALKSNYFKNTIKYFLKVGKIVLDIEYILELIRLNNFTLLETIYVAGNFCSFRTNNLKNAFFLKINIQNRENDNDDSGYASFKKNIRIQIKKKSTDKTSSERKRDTKSRVMSRLDNSVVLDANDNVDIDSLNPNLIALYKYGKAKLTISILIILSNLDLGKKTNDLRNKLIRSVILLDKQKKDSIEIMESLYNLNLESFTVSLLEANLLNINFSLFEVALKFKDMQFILAFYSLYSDFAIFKSDELHLEIINGILSNTFNIEVYLYLVRKLIKYFSLKAVKNLLKAFETLLNFNDEMNPVIFYSYNQFKIFVLLAEILELLSRSFSTLSYNCKLLSSKCLKISEEIQNSIDEDNQLRELVVEKDLVGRSVLEIISDNKFLSLLKNNLIEKIIDEQWNGMYDLNGGLLESSSAYQSLFVSLNSKDYDIFTKLRNRKIYKTNLTQYKVWVKHITPKFLYDVIVGLVTLIFIQWVNLTNLDYYKNIILSDRNYVISSTLLYKQTFTSYNIPYDISSISKNTTLDAIFNTNSSLYYNLTNITTAFSNTLDNFNNLNSLLYYNIIFAYLIVFIPAGFLVRIIYSIKKKRVSISNSIILDLLLSSLSVAIIAILNGAFIRMSKYTGFKNTTITNINTFNFTIDDFSKNYLDIIDNDPLSTEFLLLSIYNILFWLKFIIILKGTKTFGPLIVTFILSFKGIIVYLISLLFIVLLFSIFAMMNFYAVDTYFNDNLFYSFIYHFFTTLSSIGPFEPFTTKKVLKNKPYLDYLAGSYVVILNVLNTIILFNLIIALLSNIYENYRINSIQLYIREKIKLKNYFSSSDIRYNSLLLLPFPLNILLLPFSLLYIFISNDTKLVKLNNLISQVSFSFFLIIYFISFLLLSILLIPVVYLKILITKFIQIFVSDIQEYYKQFKIISFISYAILGIPVQIISLYYDILTFFRNSYNGKTTKIIESEQTGRFIIKAYLIQKFKDFSRKLVTQFSIESLDELLFLEEFTKYIDDEQGYSYVPRKRKLRLRKKISNQELKESNENNERINRFRKIEAKLFQNEIELDSITLFVENFVVNDIINISQFNLILNNKITFDLNAFFFFKFSDKSNKISFKAKYKSFLKNSSVYVSKKKQSLLDVNDENTENINTDRQFITNSIKRNESLKSARSAKSVKFQISGVSNIKNADTSSIRYKKSDDVKQEKTKTNDSTFFMSKSTQFFSNQYDIPDGTLLFPILPRELIKQVISQQSDYQIDKTQKLFQSVENNYKNIGLKIDTLSVVNNKDTNNLNKGIESNLLSLLKKQVELERAKNISSDFSVIPKNEGASDINVVGNNYFFPKRMETLDNTIDMLITSFNKIKQLNNENNILSTKSNQSKKRFDTATFKNSNNTLKQTKTAQFPTRRVNSKASSLIQSEELIEDSDKESSFTGYAQPFSINFDKSKKTK